MTKSTPRSTNTLSWVKDSKCRISNAGVMYVDTHLDTLWQSTNKSRGFADRSDTGHVDLPRARQAGLFVGFFTGFPTESPYATERMLASWIQFMNNEEHHLTRITDWNDYMAHKRHFSKNEQSQRNIGAVLHFEGTAGIDTEFNRLYIYHDVGLRSLSLTWNEQNQFATGVSGEKSRGITREGRDLMDVMKRLGIILDVSHLNDQSFWDVHRNAEVPIIASHSNLRKFADHPRNLTDEMVQAISDTEGSIGINFCNDFLSADQKAHPANSHCAIRMMEEVINLVGINHVHIGSDFDGCTVPDDIGDIEGIPPLLSQLQKTLTLSDTDLDKISFGNMERIIKKIWT